MGVFDKIKEAISPRRCLAKEPPTCSATTVKV